MAGKKIKAKSKGKTERIGVCRVCGCTNDEGCPEGCEWIDRARTLCSVCADASDAERRRRRADAIEDLDQELAFAAERLASLQFRRAFIEAEAGAGGQGPRRKH